MEPKMYIFVNSDLKMGKGKIAAQVGHVVQHISEEIIRSAYEQRRPPEYYFTYMKWKQSGNAKIVLKTTQEQLKVLMEMPEARHVIDAGRTQIEPNSLTVVGFYPSTTLEETVKDYKLL